MWHLIYILFFGILLLPSLSNKFYGVLLRNKLWHPLYTLSWDTTITKPVQQILYVRSVNKLYALFWI